MIAWYNLIILVLAIPVGYLVAYLCRDELVQGRRWFRLISYVFAFLGILLIAFRMYVEGLSSLFISIVALVALVKGMDKSWIRKR